MKAKHLVAGAAALALALGGLTACTDTAGGGDSSDNANWVYPVTVDPGALDPQTSASNVINNMSFMAYDAIINIDPDGNLRSNLASEWSYDGGLTATFTVKDGITCSDGSTLTAQTVADNFNWIADVNNGAIALGVYYPIGATAAASGNTVTLTLASPSPFLLESIANIPLVCDAGLADRSLLQAGTVGSGPYELTEAVVDDHYTYTRRDGYTWGPDGASTSSSMPKYVTFRMVGNETTGVNLFLAGELNGMSAVGPDLERLAASGADSFEVPYNADNMWFNHLEGRPTADVTVREALVTALDWSEIATVITAGAGGLPKQLSVVPPVTCQYDAISGHLPATSAAAAGAVLEAAGYAKGADGMYAKDGSPLTVIFYHMTDASTSDNAAAELAAQMWAEAGITVDLRSVDSVRLQEIMFGDGDWDIAWLGFNVGSPDQLIGFLSGPGPAGGGVNLGYISNPDYDAYVAEAFTSAGMESCNAFQQAEEALYDNFDFFPLAQNVTNIYYQGFTFELTGHIEATSLTAI
jgi:peptide/nickel transport system substrate-binding protein